MTDSKKELILKAIETAIRKIKKGNLVSSTDTVVYDNTVTYVDRQYINITEEEAANSKKPWVIINDDGERFDALPSHTFENTVLVQIIGFVSVEKETDRLDTLMTSLQKDILVAMLVDESLGGLAEYLIPRSIFTVPEMIHPHGGFVINLEIAYVFKGINL